jgi:hypothetical protein
VPKPCEEDIQRKFHTQMESVSQPIATTHPHHVQSSDSSSQYLKSLDESGCITIILFEFGSRLEIGIIWNSFQTFVIYAGDLRIEILEEGFHSSIKDSQYLLRLISW